jgi:hypothetical protein
MSRRPATCIWVPFVAGLAALALTGCGGGGREAPVPPPIAASKPAENPQPDPTPAASVEAPPVATPAPSPEPPVMPETSLPPAIPPSPSPDPNAKPPQKPPDALQWLADGEARKADYQRRVAEAEASVADANAKAATWERTALAFKNPYLARPKLSPEDAQAIAGMGGAGRVQWAEGRVVEANAARDAAQKTLDELKANPPLN